MFHWVLCAPNILTLLDSSQYTSSSVPEQLPFADEWNHQTEPTEQPVSTGSFSAGATVESFPWAVEPGCLNVCYAYVHRKFWHYNNIYNSVCNASTGDPGLVSQLTIRTFAGLPGLCSMFHCVSRVYHGRPWFCFIVYLKSIGNVLLYIICVFTGDPCFVCMCIMHIRKAFY